MTDSNEDVGLVGRRTVLSGIWGMCAAGGAALGPWAMRLPDVLVRRWNMLSARPPLRSEESCVRVRTRTGQSVAENVATGRGLGFVDNVPDNRDLQYPLDRIVQSVDRLPKLVELVNYVDHVRDQKRTSSCVGFAVARAVNMRARIQGIGTKYGSATYAYAGGRALANGYPRRLRDDGSRPRDVMKFVKEFGFAAEENWPFDPQRINDQPDWKALESGQRQLEQLDHGLLAYYWIEGDGEKKLEGFKKALAAGFPVAFAIDVDEDFESWNDDKPIPDLPEDAPILGSHYIVAVGYTPEDNILAVNSWGSAWGDFGFCEISKARILNDSTRAACAIEVAPRIESN